jgi:hypothetical protein
VDLHEFESLFRLANPYQARYATQPQRAIRPKPRLTGERLNLAMMQLVGSTNGEGYDHALTEVFGDDEVPHRASFSKARQAVSWTFYRDSLEKLTSLVDPHRTTFGGLKVYAMDGHQLVLPYTKDIYQAGFTGFPLEDDKETYTLRAYMSHCFDVLTGVTAGVTFSTTNNEHRDRKTLLPKVQDGSLVLYDRAYFSASLVEAHASREKVYFLVRCKRTSSKEIEEFFAGSETRSSTRRYGKRIYFFKVFHPGTNEPTVYATDLPENWHRVEVFSRLYRMRWEIETEQRDLTETVKLEQWHSTSLNGILQEFYATLWLINAVRISMLFSGAKSVSPMDDSYEKANFKLCFNFVAGRLSTWLSAPAALMIKLSRIVKRTTEKRRRYSRSYPREIKRPRSPYVRNSTVASKARPPPGR